MSGTLPPSFLQADLGTACSVKAISPIRSAKRCMGYDCEYWRDGFARSSVVTEGEPVMHARAALLLAVVLPLFAEQGVLVVQVKDIHKQAVAALQVRAEGGAVAAPTDVAGIARILRLRRNSGAIHLLIG